MKHTTVKDAVRREAERAYLDKVHGPSEPCVFRTLRLNAGLSLQGLAIQTGLSKNALVRAEQGTYANPLPSLVEYWVSRLTSQVTELTIVESYEDYQYAQRKRFLHYFGPNLQAGYDPLDDLHPFRQLRHSRPSHVDFLPLPVGLTEVSQDLCLPVDTLRFWEKKFRSQQSIPKQVITALLMSGYTQYEVGQFCRDYELWRSSKTKLKLVPANVS